MEKFDYKPNSYKFKAEEQASEETKPVEVQKVVQGPVVVKKKTGVKKLLNMLITDDLPKIKDYIFKDVLIPSIKRAADEIITNSSHMLFYGETARRKDGYPGTKVTFKDYSSYSKPSSSSYSSSSNTERTGFDYEDYVFNFRGDAEMVLAEMENILAKYRIVRVSQLYDLMGKKNNNYCVYNYGWTNLDNAKVVRVSDGYVLQLPKPYSID